MLGRRIHKTYATIVQGKIAIKTTESDPMAIRREAKNPQTGETIIKYEQIFDNMEGLISNIEFVEGDYGQQIQIEIDGVVLSMSTDSNYGIDLMKKLPGINLSETVNIVPYSLETKEGKNKRGIVVYQGKTEALDKDKKIQDQFFNFETKEYLEGYPAPKEAMEKDDWKIYFIEVRRFLVNYITENVLPKMEEVNQNRFTAEPTSEPEPTPMPEEEEEIPLKDIPF